MLRKIRIVFLSFLVLFALFALRVQAAAPKVDVLTVKGTINPVLVDYIRHGIEGAKQDGAGVVIIEMDTPGGLDDSMRKIIQDIVNSSIPIVVYVSPSGARAASAGAYITLASHVAVMAPNTAIGAATPVSLTGDIAEELKNKITNDAAAYIKSLADSHGRNAEWAERAVREGISASSDEALKLNIVDFNAATLDELLTKLDGRQVKMLGGNTVTLQTRGAAVNRVPMNFAENFLYAIADPNIAYLLLSLAGLGILTEITRPGLIFPGVVGAMAGLLAFYSLGILPVNLTGILLIVLAFGLFIAEILTPGFSLFTAGGVASLVIGSLILFQGIIFRVSPWLIAIVSIVIAGFIALATSQVIRAQHRQPYTGMEELIGKTGVVRVTLNPGGTILISGELWRAEAESGFPIKPGEEVVVTRHEGLKLWVIKK